MSTTNPLERNAPEAKLSIPAVAAAADEMIAARGPCDAAVGAPESEDVLILVRFYPDSRVWEIAERPESLDKEQWFKLLCARVGGKYQARAGGRGFFRVSRTELEALKTLRPH